METKIIPERNENDPPGSRVPKEKILFEESPKQPDSFFVPAKKILIRPEVKKNGIKLNVDENSFSIIYPRNLWSKYPFFAQKNLSENLAFALTFHLPFFAGVNLLQYQTPKPQILEILKAGFSSCLSSVASLKSQKTSELLEEFSAIKYRFEPLNNRKKGASFPTKIKNIAVMPFTFGKDSLLTFGVCQELGIKPLPIFVKEPLTKMENFQKEKLAKQFLKEFKKRILFINNGAGTLREHFKEKSDREGSYGWELQLTHFGLMLLPVAFSKKARYLFFSNEQSCNDKFQDAEGFWCNPVYEQSSEWTLKTREMAKILGMEDLKIASLVEPIHEIAVIKILHHRYPKLAKFQMSCGEDLPETIDYRWCENCSKCARNYIFFLANGINPKKVGIKNNLLDLKYQNKFTLFKKDVGSIYGYDASGLSRDEQLLAFYLAYKRGYKGDLIELFKKIYLKEAKSREKELKEKYFSIHSASTIPDELKEKVLKIYRQELR